MNRTLRIQRMWFAGLLGAAVLAGSPLVAQADQGKWWNPEQRGPARERRVERDVRVNRGDDRGSQRAWRHDRPSFQRQTVVLRDGRRGPRYQANRVWTRPYYIQDRRLCVIRPVRYFVTAGTTIGGVRIRARIHDQDRYYYGCNFCDARFGGYSGYRDHVIRCDDRPRGYRLDVNDWDDEWNSGACDVDGCSEHGGYQGDRDVDGCSEHGGYQGDEDDDGYR